MNTIIATIIRSSLTAAAAVAAKVGAEKIEALDTPIKKLAFIAGSTVTAGVAVDAAISYVDSKVDAPAVDVQVDIQPAAEVTSPADVNPTPDAEVPAEVIPPVASVEVKVETPKK